RGIADQASGAGLGEVVDPDLEWKPYEGMLAIPYWLPNGECMSIKFRRIDQGTPKYLNTSGTTVPPYNVGAGLKAQGTIDICVGGRYRGDHRGRAGPSCYRAGRGDRLEASLLPPPRRHRQCDCCRRS